MKLLRRVKTIRSKDDKLHFERFAILESDRFSIYVHRIYESDKDEYLHSHPWNFLGIILKGSYVERYKKEGEHGFWVESRTLKPFSISKGDLNYYHKIEHIVNGPVTTLFFVGRKYHTWFYDIAGRPVEHDVYRKRKRKSSIDVND